MIITIGGAPGSGKSTVAKAVAARLGYHHYSAGGFMRQMASERNISLMELSAIAEADSAIDLEIDARTRKLGKREDNFCIDTHVGFHFIPRSLKVFLAVDADEGARRIFNESRSNEKYNKTLAETKRLMLERIASEKERFTKYYAIDPYYLANYDLVIDTTSIPVEQVVERIMAFVRKHG